MLVSKAWRRLFSPSPTHSKFALYPGIFLFYFFPPFLPIISDDPSIWISPHLIRLRHAWFATFLNLFLKMSALFDILLSSFFNLPYHGLLAFALLWPRDAAERACPLLLWPCLVFRMHASRSRRPTISRHVALHGPVALDRTLAQLLMSPALVDDMIGNFTHFNWHPKLTFAPQWARCPNTCL